MNEPAAIALANHQQYREVIRVKDLLADDKHYLQNELRKGIGGTLVGADYGLKGGHGESAAGCSPVEPGASDWRDRYGKGSHCERHSRTFATKVTDR